MRHESATSINNNVGGICNSRSGGRGRVPSWGNLRSLAYPTGDQRTRRWKFSVTRNPLLPVNEKTDSEITPEPQET
jgi:hypothetical protein